MRSRTITAGRRLYTSGRSRTDAWSPLVLEPGSGSACVRWGVGAGPEGRQRAVPARSLAGKHTGIELSIGRCRGTCPADLGALSPAKGNQQGH